MYMVRPLLRPLQRSALGSLSPRHSHFPGLTAPVPRRPSTGQAVFSFQGAVLRNKKPEALRKHKRMRIRLCFLKASGIQPLAHPRHLAPEAIGVASVPASAWLHRPDG